MGAALCALVALGAQTASAATIQLSFLGGVAGTATGGAMGTLDFIYQVSLTGESTISSGLSSNGEQSGRLVLEDFQGFNTLGSKYIPFVAGTSYSFSSYVAQTTANNSGTPLLADLTTVNNVEFRYDGSTLTNSTTGSMMIIGTLFVNSSIFTGVTDDTYTSDLRKQAGDPSSGPYTGPGNDFSITTVARSGGITIETPLPAAAWGGLGLFGILAGNRVRKARR